MSEFSDYTDLLNDAAQSEIAKLHEFRVSFYADETSFHVFVEGSDDPLYYLTAVRDRLEQRELHCYCCNGKPALRELWSDIREEQFDSSRYVFFADRDFDDYLDCQIEISDRIYITDYYSIENNLVNLEAIKVVLIDFAGMSRADPAYAKVLEDFQKEYSRFVRLMRPLMAWAITMKSGKKKPNIRNVDIGRVFTWSNEGYIRRKSNGYLAFRTSAGLKGEFWSLPEIRKWTHRFKNDDPKLWIRGKFDLWFLRRFLQNKLKYLHTSKGAAPPEWKIPAHILQGNFFETIGPRLRKPKSLCDFLDKAI